jgi:hypothetical protein
MPPSVGTQIAISGFFDQSQGVPTNLYQLREHSFLCAQQLWIYGYRRLQPNHPLLHQREWQAKSLQHRSLLRLFSENSVGRANDHTFHDHYVGYDFGGGPAVLSGACFPEYGRNRIGGAQQAGLRAGKLVENSCRYRHDVFGKNLTLADRQIRRLQCGPARLLESLCQLQYTAFPKRRPENL